MTADSTSSYIIPPYLLDTCIGSLLQQQVAEFSKELSIENVIDPSSPFYSNVPENSNISLLSTTSSTTTTSLSSSSSLAPTTMRVQKNELLFHTDPLVNETIKEKLINKLSIIGVLGNNPMEFNRFDDKYLLEMYEIFKPRILVIDSELEEEEIQKDPIDGKPVQVPRSVFASEQIGEINYKGIHRRPEKKVATTKEERNHIYNDTSYYANELKSKPLKVLLNRNEASKPLLVNEKILATSDGSRYLTYQLPTKWSPLIPNPYLNYLKMKYHLQVTNENGFATIKLKRKGVNGNKETPEAKGGADFVDDKHINDSWYYNFISDAPVKSTQGVFYYEIEMENVLTQATNFQSLIHTIDPSMSINSSLDLFAGFTKRHIIYDSNKAVSVANDKHVKNMDLEKVKHNVLYDIATEGFSVDELNLLLGNKPGELKGTFAINFEDSKFYNSMKISDSLLRSHMMNMNRRLSSTGRANQNVDLDEGKMFLGTEVKTEVFENSSTSSKIQKSDVVGCGINFVDKSVFFTLNGVLAKVITEKELVSSTSPVNDLFHTKEPHSSYPIEIYPIIGFQLNKLNELDNLGISDASTSKVITNLGFKEFKFDIKDYINKVKLQNQVDIHLSQLEKMRQKNFNGQENADLDCAVEDALLGGTSNSDVLNKMIKEYLVYRGHTETLSAFESDLNATSSIPLLKESTQQNSTDEKEDLFNKTNGSERILYKNLIFKNKFTQVYELLIANNGELKLDNSAQELKFNLCKLDYLYKLRKFITAKLTTEKSWEKIPTTANNQNHENQDRMQTFYDEAVSCRNNILNEFSNDYYRAIIDELTPLLFVQLQAGLDRLPRTKKLLDDFESQRNEMFDLINEILLRNAGSKRKSCLEQIFEGVEVNINDQARGFGDGRFTLVNLDRDYYNEI